MISIRQTLRRLSPWHREIMSFDRATEDDIYFCYRLLLGREPDQEGWDYFKKRLHSVQIPVAALVDEFLNCQEFRTKQSSANIPVLIRLDEFAIYVRRNDHYIGSVIESARSYESHVTTQVVRLLNEGDTFLDIGANIGYFTLMAATIVGPKGHVHAFEPLKSNLELLTRSLEVNAFNNVTIHPCAVAEERTTFCLEPNGYSSNARVLDLSDSTAIEDKTELIIEGFPLDDLLKDCDQIDVIKMDIEGAEPRAWRGMTEILQRYKPVIIFEFFPHLIRSTSHIEPTTFLTQIIESGYELSVIDNRNGQLVAMGKPQMVIDWWERSGFTHIDLLAAPRV